MFSNLHGILKVNLVIWKSYLVIWEIIVNVVILKGYWLIHFLRERQNVKLYLVKKRLYYYHNIENKKLNSQNISSFTRLNCHANPKPQPHPYPSPHPTPIYTYPPIPTPHILNTSHLPNHTVFLTKWSSTYFSIQYLFFEKLFSTKWRFLI